MRIEKETLISYFERTVLTHGEEYRIQEMFHAGNEWHRKREEFFHSDRQCLVSRDNIEVNIELWEQHAKTKRIIHSNDTESSAIDWTSSLCVNEQTNIIRSECEVGEGVQVGGYISRDTQPGYTACRLTRLRHESPQPRITRAPRIAFEQF